MNSYLWILKLLKQIPRVYTACCSFVEWWPLLSGFLALLALAIYTGVTVTFFGKRFLDWRFSWSYIIGWVAIILAFAAGASFIFLFSPWAAFGGVGVGAQSTTIAVALQRQKWVENKQISALHVINDSVKPSFQACFSCAPTSGPLPNLRLQITWTAEQRGGCCTKKNSCFWEPGINKLLSDFCVSSLFFFLNYDALFIFSQ